MADDFHPDLFNPPPGFTIRKPPSVAKERAKIRAFLEREIRLPEKPRPAAPVKTAAPVRAKPEPEPVTPEEVSRFREAVEAQRRAALTAPEPLPPPPAPPDAATRARLAEYHHFKTAVKSGFHPDQS